MDTVLLPGKILGCYYSHYLTSNAVCVMIWMINYTTQLYISAITYNNNNGPIGHLFYVGGDLMMRRGMLPIIMLPDGYLRIVLHLVPFWILTIWGSVHMPCSRCPVREILCEIKTLFISELLQCRTFLNTVCHTIHAHGLHLVLFSYTIGPNRLMLHSYPYT